MSTGNDGEKKKNFLSNISNAVGIGGKPAAAEGPQDESGDRETPGILFEDENFLKPRNAQSGAGARPARPASPLRPRPPARSPWPNPA